MAHTCKAGCQKLVVMYDGRIIPCEAFKGLVDEYPRLVLGNIHDGTTLPEALKRAEGIPLLHCFRDGEMDPSTMVLVDVTSKLYEALKCIDQHEKEHPGHPWMAKIHRHLKNLHRHVVHCSIENEEVRNNRDTGLIAAELSEDHT